MLAKAFHACLLACLESFTRLVVTLCLLSGCMDEGLNAHTHMHMHVRMHKLSKHFIVCDQARLHANAHSLACPFAAGRSKFFQSLGPGSRRTVRTSMVVSWTAVVGRGNNQNKPRLGSSTNLENTKSFSHIQLFRQRSCVRFLAFCHQDDPLASSGRPMSTAAVLSRQQWTRCLHKSGMDADATKDADAKTFICVCTLRW
jgi:hypothetical protein